MMAMQTATDSAKQILHDLEIEYNLSLIHIYSNYNANPSVIRQYVNNSWRTKEYIERLGIKMIPTQQLELEDIGDPK